MAPILLRLFSLPLHFLSYLPLDFSDYADPNVRLGANLSLIATSSQNLIQEILFELLQTLGNLDLPDYTQIYTTCDLKRDYLLIEKKASRFHGRGHVGQITTIG